MKPVIHTVDGEYKIVGAQMRKNSANTFRKPHKKQLMHTYEIKNKNCLFDFHAGNFIPTLVVSTENYIVATNGKSKILVWGFGENGKREVKGAVDKTRFVTCMLPLEGECVAIGASDGSVNIWNMDKLSWRELASFSNKPIVALAYCPKKVLFAVAYDDGVHFIFRESHEELCWWPKDGIVNMCLLTTGKLAVVCEDSGVAILEMGFEKQPVIRHPIDLEEGHTPRILALSGGRLAIQTCPSYVCIIETEGKIALLKSIYTREIVNSMCLLTDNLLVFGGTHGCMEFLDTNTLELVGECFKRMYGSITSMCLWKAKLISTSILGWVMASEKRHLFDACGALLEEKKEEKEVVVQQKRYDLRKTINKKITK